MNLMRSSRSNTHDDRGFSDGYALLAHASGTWLSKIESVTASSSSVITTRPLSALSDSCRVLRITTMRLLYLMHSCVSTVFMDWL